MHEVFGPEGLIASTHPDYEHRPGQIKMAEAVLRAFEQRRHLIVEAGTGTGKTLAYLVPAIAAACGSGARVVISTGTKNLQEQLMDKDIPFLQDTLPAKFRAAVMKGRNNYACLHRIKRAESMPVLDGLDQIDQFDEVFRWSTTTETGESGRNVFRDRPPLAWPQEVSGVCRGYRWRATFGLLRRQQRSPYVTLGLRIGRLAAVGHPHE